MKCSKCDSIERLTLHHQNPVCHFGKRNNRLKVCLCKFCHCNLEFQIKAVEDYVRGSPAPYRHKLERKDYELILRNFLGNRKIIYMST
jgi:hypothetical protein